MKVSPFTTSFPNLLQCLAFCLIFCGTKPAAMLAQCDCSQATLILTPPSGYGCPTTANIYSTAYESATAYWTSFWGSPAEQELTFVNGVATFEMGLPLTFSIRLWCAPGDGCWILQNYTPDWSPHSPVAQFISTCGVPNGSVGISDNDGNCLSIEVYAIQSEPPYHSFNATVPSGGSITVPNVPPGTYNATLSSYVYFGNYWVTSTQTFVVNSGPTATFQKIRPTCFGDSDGALKCNPKPLLGGTGYTYLWNTGASTREISNIPAGTYSVTMTQIATGCTGVASIELTEPAQLTTSLTTVHAKCFGDMTGRVVAYATGGSGTKTYLWSTGGTQIKIQDLAAGTYTVTVTDSKGCTTSAEAIVTEPPVLMLSHTVEILANGKFKVTLTADGGTPYPTGSLYKYCRVSATGSCGFTSNNAYIIAAAGTHIFRARDKNACEVAIDVTLPPAFGPGTVDERNRNSVSDFSAADFALSPNPFDNQLVVNAGLPLGSRFKVKILDATGRLVIEKTWPLGADRLSIEDTNDWPPGVFFVQITDEQGVTHTTLQAIKTN